MRRFYQKLNSSSKTLALLDNREECFKKLDEDLVTVLQLKANIVGLHPRQVLWKQRNVTHSPEACSDCPSNQSV